MPPDQIQQQIDHLLQHHLTLLDQYTRLRRQLSRLQSSTFQDIALANFSAPRGQRFGRDHYDQRMRASRRVAIGGTPARVSVTSVEEGDPLRWYGLLTPAPLRAAQACSIEAVEEVIPRLVSVVAEMQHVEIEVRRARKRRDKAEGSARKAGSETENARASA